MAYGLEEVQAAVAAQQAQGYMGTVVDPTPNANYTLDGVGANLPTPETDGDLYRIVRDSLRDGDLAEALPHGRPGFYIGLAPAAYTTATTGPDVDLGAADAYRVTIVAVFGVVTDGSFAIGGEHSDDGETWEAVTTADFGGIAWTAVTTAEDESVQVREYIGGRDYFRVLLGVDGAPVTGGLVAVIVHTSPY